MHTHVGFSFCHIVWSLIRPYMHLVSCHNVPLLGNPPPFITNVRSTFVGGFPLNRLKPTSTPPTSGRVMPSPLFL